MFNMPDSKHNSNNDSIDSGITESKSNESLIWYDCCCNAICNHSTDHMIRDISKEKFAKYPEIFTKPFESIGFAGKELSSEMHTSSPEEFTNNYQPVKVQSISLVEFDKRLEELKKEREVFIHASASNVIINWDDEFQKYLEIEHLSKQESELISDADLLVERDPNNSYASSINDDINIINDDDKLSTG